MSKLPKFPRKRDPSRTLGIRNGYVRAMNVRFNTLLRAIREYIVENDALGYRSTSPGIPIFNAPFEYTMSGEKLKAFDEWIDQQIQRGILAESAEWGEGYIDSAYKQGQRRAMEELKKSGLDEYSGVDIDHEMNSVLIAPVHRDELNFLHSRNYSALKGITADMSAKMGYALATGLSEGLSPRDIAKSLAKVEGMSLRRARTVARTEVMRSHHLALFNTYKEAQVLEVLVYVEWSAAKDDVICPECEMLDGKIFRLDSMRDAIPMHPNCRCVLIPYIPIPGEALPDVED